MSYLIGFLQPSPAPHLQNSQQVMFLTLHGQTVLIAHLMQLQGVGKSLGSTSCTISGER